MELLPFKKLKVFKVFLFSLSFIVSFTICILFLGFYIRSNNLLFETVKEQASSYFRLIVNARKWNANYGGIYVEKKQGVESNVYLRDIGIEPDVRCEGGRILTMRNPAMMTREMSRLLEEQTGVKFHITSLKPVNPNNTPNVFEKKAFGQFDQGFKDYCEIDRTGESILFRYMAPLYVEHPCLHCHENQGYKIGDIRGGISIDIPLDKLTKEIRKNRVMIAILTGITVILIIAMIYFLIWKLAKQLAVLYGRLEEMAITDELTKIFNRRHILERFEAEFQRMRRTKNPLSLIMLDLDYFKRINDTFGHPFGDYVLKTVADRIKVSIRDYDLLGRLGGEEFLVVSPYLSMEETVEVAKRIRTHIKGEKIAGLGHEITITVSAGVATLREQDVNVNTLLSRVDSALYKAKQEGRDREVSL